MESQTLLYSLESNQGSIKKGKLVVAFLFIGMMLLAITFVTLFLVQYFREPKGNQVFIAFSSSFTTTQTSCAQYFVVVNEINNVPYFQLNSKPVAFNLETGIRDNVTVYEIQYRGKNVQPGSSPILIEQYNVFQYFIGLYQIAANVDGMEQTISVDSLNNVVIGGSGTLGNPNVFFIGPYEMASQVLMC
jgi:hypothetical protein